MKNGPTGAALMKTAIRRRQSSPTRQQRKPITACSLIVLSEAVQVVASRVAEIARARGCCAYVFVRSGQVYVISEDNAQAHRWAVGNTSEWVGCYGGTPDRDGLLDDLRLFVR